LNSTVRLESAANVSLRVIQSSSGKLLKSRYGQPASLRLWMRTVPALPEKNQRLRRSTAKDAMLRGTGQLPAELVSADLMFMSTLSS
jgi:hypothetical protein